MSGRNKSLTPYSHFISTCYGNGSGPMDGGNENGDGDTEGKTHLGPSQTPPGANIMDSMWIYDVKWDGEGNRIKDKARLVGKGYTQQFGVDYNETWAGVTQLKSVRMTAAIAARHDLMLW
jgi:hypothetical protein